MSDEHINDNEEKTIILEDEKTLLLDHDYDGIQELNHPLPFWWVWIFILTTVFAIPYVYYVHIKDEPLTIEREFNAGMAEVKALREANAQKEITFDQAAYDTFIGSEDAKAMGAKNYKRRCRSCHGANGEGGIGPNLTDKFWIHGTGSASSIYAVIDKGVDSNGMPAWGEVLDKDVLFAITAHILAIQGSNPENAKAPQGIEAK